MDALNYAVGSASKKATKFYIFCKSIHYKRITLKLNNNLNYETHTRKEKEPKLILYSVSHVKGMIEQEDKPKKKMFFFRIRESS